MPSAFCWLLSALCVLASWLWFKRSLLFASLAVVVPAVLVLSFALVFGSATPSGACWTGSAAEKNVPVFDCLTKEQFANLDAFNSHSETKQAAAAVVVGLSWLAPLLVLAVAWFQQKDRAEDEEAAGRQRLAEDERLTAVCNERLAAEQSPGRKLGMTARADGKNIVLERSGLLKSSPASVLLGFSYAGNPLRYCGDKHLLTVAPTGSGKNTTAQTPALLSYDGSAFVIDPKGQLAAITARHRCEVLGQTVYCINPFQSLGLPSVAYNPLRHLNPASLTFATDCARVADGLIEMSKGDHWETSARDLVGLLIMWTVCHGEESGYSKSLATVKQILDLPDELRVEFFRGLLSSPRWEISSAAGRYTSDSKEVRDCIQTAVVQLGFLRDEAILRVLDGSRAGLPEISFADLKRKKQTVYLILPPELLQTHGRFLRLLVMSALGELYKERTRAAAPVLFMLDEFPALGKMPIVQSVASVGRDYQIKLWMVAQNIPQLIGLYGREWESLVSAAGVVQFFAPSEPETADWLSRRLGVRMERFTTSSTSSGTTRSAGAGSSFSSGTNETQGERERRVLEASDIYSFGADEQLLITSEGGSTIKARRLPYWQHKGGNWLLCPDPYHNAESAAKFAALMASASWFGHIPQEKQHELVLSAGMEQQLFKTALNALPGEAGGLLASCNGVVNRLYPLPNTAPGLDEFQYSNSSKKEAIERLQRDGYRLVGHYHSHPDRGDGGTGAACPSQGDTAHLRRVGLPEIIVGLQKKELAAYRAVGSGVERLPLRFV